MNEEEEKNAVFHILVTYLGGNSLLMQSNTLVIYKQNTHIIGVPEFTSSCQNTNVSVMEKVVPC